MKYSYEIANKAENKDSKEKQMQAKIWWWAGLVACILGAYGNVMSVKFGNLILLASSCAITMIFNLVLSYYILHESFTKWDALVILVISIGSTSCMVLSKQSDEVRTNNEILKCFLGIPNLIIYLSAVMYLVFAYLYNDRVKEDVMEAWAKISRNFPSSASTSRYMTNQQDDADEDHSLTQSVPCSANNIKLKNQMAILSALNRSQKIILKLDLQKITEARIRAPLVVVTCGGGMLVAFTITFIKGATITLQVEEPINVELTIFIALAVITSLMQLVFINLSMEIYDQIDTIPIFQSAQIVFNLFSGSVVMQEYKLYTTSEFLTLMCCGLVAIIGVFIIVMKPPPKTSVDLSKHFGSSNSKFKNRFDIEEQIKNFAFKAPDDQLEICRGVNFINQVLEMKTPML